MIVGVPPLPERPPFGHSRPVDGLEAEGPEGLLGLAAP